MDGPSTATLRGQAAPLLRRPVVIAVITAAAVAGGAMAVAAVASKDAAVAVPGMGVAVENVPKDWTMRPAEWELTSVGGETVVATSTWWAPADLLDVHNAIEVCVEKVDQATCATSGDSVISQVKLSGGKRATVSIVERDEPIDASSDRKIWRQVVVR